LYLGFIFFDFVLAVCLVNTLDDLTKNMEKI